MVISDQVAHHRQSRSVSGIHPAKWTSSKQSLSSSIAQLYSTARTAQHNRTATITQHSPAQHSTAQHSIYSTTQHSTTHHIYSTTQHLKASTVRHCTVHHSNIKVHHIIQHIMPHHTTARHHTACMHAQQWSNVMCVYIIIHMCLYKCMYIHTHQNIWCSNHS